jgi:hypothetical protein
VQQLTVAELIRLALEAYPTLVALGESVEDEWQYVTDLSTAWRARLETVAAARREDEAPEGGRAAIEEAVTEIALITDPHRAIDWLSTFPQVVLAMVGETG